MEKKFEKPNTIYYLLFIPERIFLDYIIGFYRKSSPTTFNYLFRFSINLS